MFLTYAIAARVKRVARSPWGQKLCDCERRQTSHLSYINLFTIDYTKWDECTRSCASYILTKLSLQHLSQPLRHSIGTHRAAWHRNVGQRQWIEEEMIEVQPLFDLMAAKGPRVCQGKEGETEQPPWHRPFQALKDRSTDTWNKQQGLRWTWASLKIPLLSPRQINILSVQHRPPSLWRNISLPAKTC